MLIKYVPFVILIMQILYSIFAYNNWNVEIINLICCVSIPQIIILYVSSYVFNYCKWYRYSLNTIILTNIIALIDIFIGIPISDLNILRVYLGILIIGLISYSKFILKK